MDGHLSAPSWVLFLVSSVCGAALLLAGRPESVADRLARGAVIVGLCAALAVAMPPLLARAHVIPGAAAAAAGLLVLAGRRAAVGADGALILDADAGATGVALTFELAALPALLRSACALAALEGSARVPGIALRAAAWGAFRLLLAASARAEGFDEPWFREPAVTFLTMLPLALRAPVRGRFMKVPAGLAESAPSKAAFVLAALAAGASVGFWWNFHDPGPRSGGRVVIDESHSGWEPTDGPFDASEHGQRSLYNYALWRRWVASHYPVRVAREPLGERDLADADVLVIKTPTRPYEAAAIAAIERFVHDGGGLLLIGDHTNLFGMSSVLNRIASPFGLAFMHDDTFPLDHTHPDVHRPSRWFRHPVLRGIESYPFETSCTLGASWRADPVVIGRRLGAEPADYGHMNFFGNIALDADEPFGLFVQAAVTSHGGGRVAAFSDSTNFSNFSMLWEGRRTLTLNLIDWLDRRPAPLPRRAFPAVVLVAGMAFALYAAWRARGAAPALLAAGLWAALPAFAAAGAAASRAGIALAGEVAPIAPIRRVAFDRSLGRFEPSDVSVILDRSEPALDAYHSFFIDTARAGLWPEVSDDLVEAAGESAAIVVIDPDRGPDHAEQEALGRFLRRGGRLLVIDSVLNRGSAAGALLRSIGIEMRTIVSAGAEAAPRLAVRHDAGWVRSRLDAGVTAYSRDIGRGRVVVAIDGAAFSDAAFGGVYVNPDAAQIERRDAQSALLHLLMGGV